MKNSYYILFILSILIIIIHRKVPKRIKYPLSKVEEVYDVYFDTTINDPYRWLEDNYSNETKSWVIKQNAVTNSYMRRINHTRNIKNRLKEIWNYPWQSAPFSRGERLYFYLNEGLQDQSILFEKISETADPEVLIDPNKFSSDGKTSLSDIYFSNDNRYLGYSISNSGSDWKEFYILDLRTKNLLKDRLKWIKFSGMSWKDNGFYYTRYPEKNEKNELSGTNENGKVYYHKLGTLQENDELIYYNPETPRISPYISVTKDERFIFLYQYLGTYGNSLFFRDTRKTENGWSAIIDDYNSEITVMNHLSGMIIAITDRNAPNKKIVRIDPEYPEEDNWITLISGTANSTLESANIVGNKIFVHFTNDVISQWKAYNLDGIYLYDIQMPGKGIVNGFLGDKDDIITWYTFNNLITPQKIYQYDTRTNSSTLYLESKSTFNSNEYIMKQEFYLSKDGTRIPIFIAHKKNLSLDNKRPTLLYGYGGFNISVKPNFNKALTILFENNCVYAVANIRGGNEYGETWHSNGMLLNKQNVFNDFIAAAEYLFIEGYTDPDYLAIRGRSNGGLLIGAVLNQNPQICRVAFPEVGVMDMLRYEQFTIGHAWSVEYGSVKFMKHFYNLLGYSPLHNIKSKTHYPSILIYTADHDDRVVPAHSFKYAATMQSAQAGNSPILLRVAKNIGHGRGRATKDIINEYAEKWGFMFYEMGLSP